MNNFWATLTDILKFTGINDESVWQDVLVSAVLLPLSFFVALRLYAYFDQNRPVKLLLKGFIKANTHVLLFNSQLRAVDKTGKLLEDPKYANYFPSPSPADRSRQGRLLKQNIDPVWSESDGECLASIYNLLGRAGKISGIEIADTIKGWAKHSQPIVSIGFNPKTHDLQERCKPIDYLLDITTASLTLPKTGAMIDAYMPNDGGIVQKTFLKSSGAPVIILAGLGTVGTSAAGYVLSNEARSIGKLYGNKPFCLLLKADVSIGASSGELCAIYPQPSRLKIITHLLTYMSYKKRGIIS